MVDIEGDVQKYAMSFLHIFNNARENKDYFYDVRNCSSNTVYVVCPKCHEEEVENYLSQFGEIIGKHDVKRIKVYPEVELKDFDKVYDCDVQFTVIDF